ncbi:class I SAM-dependent methyltransferase [Herbiconiux sp. YIM B11900]|uniref:class I SAM-dependent methyltransferase n=1 Tax=Herbiconiux sp. YIM B11900 TaxID=3404131 RepID=UPI003F829E01
MTEHDAETPRPDRENSPAHEPAHAHHEEGHQHGAGGRPPVDPDADVAETWDDFYRAGPRWSGKVNALLAYALPDAPSPGARALDLGCGLGADALWLAHRGWDATGVDVSQVAVDGSRALAEEAFRSEELPAGASVRFEQHDLNDDFPSGTYELVTASFLHSMVRLDREQILRRAWAAVAPGGRLVLLSHATFPAFAGPPSDVVLPTAAQTLEALALPEDGTWMATIEYAAQQMEGPDGELGTRSDHLIVVTRR